MSRDWETLRARLRRCFAAAEAMEHFGAQVEESRALGAHCNMPAPPEYGPGF